MLKALPFQSSGLHSLIIKRYCQTYDDNIVPTFYEAYTIADLFSYFITFSNILLNAPFWAYLGRPRNEGPIAQVVLACLPKALYLGIFGLTQYKCYITQPSSRGGRVVD